MTRITQLAVSTLAFICAGGALAQTPEALTGNAVPDGSSSAAVAYVYVQNVKVVANPQDGGNLYAFAAAANGKLTAVSGSPLNFNVAPQGHNDKYLFGMESNDSTIDSFLVESNGGLKKVDSLKTSIYDTGSCGNPGFFSLDKSGTKLYNVSFSADCTAVYPEKVQSFSIDGSNGELGLLNITDEDPGSGVHFSVLGNNNYSFMATANFETASDYGFATYKKLSNGSVEYMGNQWLMPSGNLGPESEEPGATFFDAELTATDASNHLVAVLHQYDQDFNDFGEFIAVYTSDSNGNLSTTNTYAQLPQVPENVYAIDVSPSGKLLAVAGDGVQLLHYNGANPPTSYKSLLSGKLVRQVAWDGDNHLYAIVESFAHPGTGELHVFTATPTSVTEAPGSPYSIPNPEVLLVATK